MKRICNKNVVSINSCSHANTNTLSWFILQSINLLEANVDEIVSSVFKPWPVSFIPVDINMSEKVDNQQLN